MVSWKGIFLMYTRMCNRADMERNLRELSKELKKEFGRNSKHEIIVVGGAAIVLKHDFRDSSSDIDAIVSDGSSIKDAVHRTAEKLGLADDWLNSDFKKSPSYSSKLVLRSKFYKCFNQVLDVRIVDDNYLIAMKLKSFRPYKNDQSDIIGLLQDNSFTFEEIESAVLELYGVDNTVKTEAWDFLKKYYTTDGMVYEQIRNEELNNKDILIEFEENYENVLKEDNLDDILSQLKAKKQSK